MFLWQTEPTSICNVGGHCLLQYPWHFIMSVYRNYVKNQKICLGIDYNVYAVMAFLWIFNIFKLSWNIHNIHCILLIVYITCICNCKRNINIIFKHRLFSYLSFNLPWMWRMYIFHEWMFSCCGPEFILVHQLVCFI